MTKSKFWLAFLFLVIFVGAFVYLGFFAHPSGDDYGMFSHLDKSGFWRTQIEHPNSRFGMGFIIQLGNLFGVMENYGYHATIWIAFGLLSMFFLLSVVAKEMNFTKKLFLALLFQAISLSAGVALQENLYWFDGSFFYWSFIILTFELAMAIKIFNDIHAKKYFFLLGALIIFNSGVSELAAAYQIPMFAGAIIVCWLSEKKQAAKYMWWLLGVAIVGLAYQVLSPANNERAAGVIGEGARNLSTIMKATAFFGPLNAVEFFTKPIIYALWLFLPIIADNVQQARFVARLPFKFKLWHIFAFEILTALGFAALGGYTGGGLPPRAVGTVIWIMLAQWILFFVFCYRDEKFIERVRNMKIYRWRMEVLILCMVLSVNFVSLVGDLGSGRAAAYSKLREERHEYLNEQKALGHLDVIVPAPGELPKLSIFVEIDEFMIGFGNAQHLYYDLNSLRAVPLEIMDVAKAGDVKREFEELTKLAEAGNVFAQVNLARVYDTRYRKVDFAEKDDAASVKWFLRAAEQGDVYSKRQLVGLLGRGWGTPDNKPDYLAAAKWYLLSMW